MFIGRPPTSVSPNSVSSRVEHAEKTPDVAAGTLGNPINTPADSSVVVGPWIWPALAGRSDPSKAIGYGRGLVALDQHAPAPAAEDRRDRAVRRRRLEMREILINGPGGTSWMRKKPPGAITGCVVERSVVVTKSSQGPDTSAAPCTRNGPSPPSQENVMSLPTALTEPMTTPSGGATLRNNSPTPAGVMVAPPTRRWKWLRRAPTDRGCPSGSHPPGRRQAELSLVESPFQ